MRLAPDQQTAGSNPVAPISPQKKLNRSVAQIKSVYPPADNIMARACRCCKGRGSNPLTPTFLKKMTVWWRWPNTIGLGPIDNSILAGSNPATVNPKKII